MNLRRFLMVGVPTLALSIFTLPAFAAADQDFLRQFAETNRFRQGRPAAIAVTPQGDAVLFLRSGSRSFVRDLFLFDPATGQEKVLLTAEQLLGGGEEELTAEEKARRERARLTARGFASFSLSNDGDSILAPLSGRLFVVKWRTGAVRELTLQAKAPIDPRFSPDGKKVAFVSAGDLYVYDLEKNHETRLTEGGGGDISHGLAEFVAQEEMSRFEGYWWSPDSQAIVFQKNDDSQLETFSILDPADPAKTPQSWKYPRAGKANTEVKLGIVPLSADRLTWIEWDRAAYPYLATVKWNRHGPLTLVVQNRHQTDELVLKVDAANGQTSELWREKDPAWLNLDQSFPEWLPDGKGWLWAHERDGAWQIELRDATGRSAKNLLPAGLSYQGLVHADQRELWVKASHNPLDRAIWRVPLDGSKPERLSADQGLFDAVVADDGSLAALTEQTVAGAWRYPVIDRQGRVKGELKSLAEVPAFPINAEWQKVGDDPGFYAVVLKPENFQPGRKLPTILFVYGGPHKQVVVRAGSEFFLTQWLANQGYLVVAIDGRGTPGRGRDFERAIHHDIIDPPLQDQVATLRKLGEKIPELDLENVGVFGWSFGGYFSAMATMRHPEMFKAGVAGAPVCDWEDYDTHYTERYLGLPQEVPEVYKKTSVRTYAEKLERPLLIIHGTADDNVYLVHGLKMSQALFAAGKHHEFLPLAGETHVVVKPEVVARMYERIVAFFAANLRDR